MSNLFKFSKVDHLENHVFDQSLENFRRAIKTGEASGTTIREILQNSMDAAIDETQAPVHVKLAIQDIPKSSLPGIDQIFDHIRSLRPQNEYVKETVDYMLEQEEKECVTVLTAEDLNTKGLSGADSNDPSSTYNVFAYNKGVHASESDSKKESSRGGSHGVGKIANNAASDIHLMYFSNCDEKGNQHTGGSIQLFDHELNGQGYRGVGYFAGEDESGRRNAHENTFNHEVFHKNERGLKIIIPYLRPELNRTEDIVRSVVNNFFVSIIEDFLKVEITINGNTRSINAATIDQIIEDPRYYVSEISEMKKNFTPLYVDTYKNTSSQNLNIPLKNGGELNFRLYFDDSKEEIKKGRTAIVRSKGMKIEDFSVKNRATRPYNAVIIGSDKEDEYLKTLENESHTELSAESIRDDKKQKEAKKFLRDLDKKLADIIDESIRQKIKSDGKLDTSEILYQSTQAFNSSIQKNQSPVGIEDSNALTKKREKRKPGVGKGTNKRNKNKRKGKRKPRRLGTNSDTGTQIVLLPSDTVNRVIVGDKEYLQIDTSRVQGLEKIERCNLSFKVINGEGKEYDEEVNLKRNYRSIFDRSTNYEYSFTENEINNIQIKDGRVTLVLEISDEYNENLKFIYKMEVEA